MRFFIAGSLLGALAVAAQASAQQGIPGNGTSLVEGWYKNFLNRPPDAYASVWVNALQQGQAPEVVLSQFLATPEYYAKGGGTREGFIQTIYQDVIGRPPTPGEMAFWYPRLAYTPQADMAYALVTYTPQTWQTPTPGYYDSDNRGYITPHHHYRRPGYPYWR